MANHIRNYLPENLPRLELANAQMRVFVTVLTIVFFLALGRFSEESVPYWFAGFIVAVTGFGIAVGWLWLVMHFPGDFVVRRVLISAVDTLLITIAVAFSGPYCPGLYPIYVQAFVAHGMRFGPREMLTAVGVASVGFPVATFWSGYAFEYPVVALLLWLGLTVLAPYYNYLMDLQRSAIEREDARRRESEARRMRWLEQTARYLRHEVNTEIAAARSGLSMAQSSSIRSRFDNDLQEYIRRAQDALDRIAKMIQDAIEASSLEAAVAKEPAQVIDLHDWVEDEIAFTYNALCPDCTFSYETGAPSLRVGVAERRLSQLFGNLMSNAIDHHLPDTTITVSVTKEDGEAALRVSNFGPVLPENLTLIFEPFRSLRQGAARQGHSGIGLYLVKVIAEAYGGRVEARNHPDEGSVDLIVCFPLADDKAGSRSRAA